MRQRRVTEAGLADLQHIHDFIAERAPNAASFFYEQALSTFGDFPDDIHVPATASAMMPEYVRVLHLASPFRGYTLWVAFLDDALYLVAAFAPGLPDAYKDRHALSSLRSIDG